MSTIKRTLPLAPLALLGACAMLPKFNVQVAGTQAEAMSARMAVLADARDLSVDEQTEQARAMVSDTAARFDVSPAPELRILREDTWLLEGRYARAVVFEGGKRAIYVSRERLAIGAIGTDVIEHEMSHFAAWDRYGYGIFEHGTQWKAMCLRYATIEASCAEVK